MPSDSQFLEFAALTLGKAAPDAEPLVVLECVLKTLVTHVACQTNPFGFSRGPTLFRKERLWIGLRTECAFLPAQLLGASVEYV